MSYYKKIQSRFLIGSFLAVSVGLFSNSPAMALPVWELGEQAAKTIAFTTNNSGGSNVNFVGDLNNDGFDDVLISQSENDDSTADVKHYLLYGSSNSFADQPISKAAHAVFTTKKGLGTMPRPVGLDINVDGYSDIVVGDKNGLFVIFGKAAKFSGTLNFKDIRGTEISNDFAATYYLDVADLNNDQINDLVINNTYLRPNVVLGSASFPTSGRAEMAASPFPSRYSKDNANRIEQFISLIGDINNDQYPDWARSVQESATKTRVEIYYGSTALYEQSPEYEKTATIKPNATLVVKPGFTSERGANQLTVAPEPIADINRDGYADLLLRVKEITSKNNQIIKEFPTDAYILYGQAESFPKTLTKKSFVELESDFLAALSPVGDVNGDGAIDFATANKPNSADRYASGFVQLFTEPVSKAATTANKVFQFSFATNRRADGIRNNLVNITATPNASGDLNGDGKADILFGADPDRGGVVYLIYGREKFTGVESKMKQTFGMSGSRVYIKHEDGTNTISRLFNGDAAKPAVDMFKSRTNALVLHGKGTQAAVINRRGEVLSTIQVAGPAQDEVDVAAFFVSTAKKQEAILLTRSNKTVKLRYVVYTNDRLKIVDTKTFQTTQKNLHLDVDPYLNTVTVQNENNDTVASYKIDNSKFVR